MADLVLQHDLLDLTLSALGGPFSAITAGSNSGTAVTGATIDRASYGVALNAALDLAFSATLGANKTLSLASVKIEHSPDGSTWTTFQTFTDPGVVATSVSGGTVTGIVRLGVPLRTAYRYIRVDYTPTLSATSPDTATVVPHLTFSGFDAYPPVAGSAA